MADLTDEEYKTLLGYRKNTNSSHNVHNDVYTGKDDMDVPDSFDWREKDAVNPVKNQGYVQNITCIKKKNDH